MAYNELIKNFDRIRDYMREFYVFGFKSREEYTRKSARSYDDERRRVESWLGEYMRFRQTPEGKNLFLSIDSRASAHNPLYAAWKTKSVTDGDITLHFLLFDLLHDPGEAYSLNELMDRIDERLAGFEDPGLPDESTVRKKLKEYVQEGLVRAEKRGRTVYYSRTGDSVPLPDAEVLDFFSETAPCGVIGSTLLDKEPPHESRFVFKHHYITGALDSEIVCALLEAMTEKREVTLRVLYRRSERITEKQAVPLRLMVSVQSGRQYLMAYVPRMDRITSYRIDNLLSVRPGGVSDRFDELREALRGMERHLWGISTGKGPGAETEHVEFTVRYGEDEQHIPQRLEREKRCGTVERLDACTSRFSADVYDAGELVPWIRTFICRITDFSFSDKGLEQRFRQDLERMYRMYGLEGGEGE